MLAPSSAKGHTMHAVILAGGKGTRLKPYTTILPKPLMPIGDLPILEVVLRQLKASGFEKITVAVGYLAELLQAFFQDGARLGLQIRYSLEDTPLGTAAPLKLIGDLPDHFLMMNGDILTTLNFRDFMDFHLNRNTIMTIASYRRTVKIDFGVIEADSNGCVEKYIEKPPLDYRVSMGIYALRADALAYIPENRYFDLPDLVKALLTAGQKISLYPFDGYWLDIGRPDDYALAIEEFETRRSLFLPEGQSS